MEQTITLTASDVVLQLAFACVLFFFVGASAHRWYCSRLLESGDMCDTELNEPEKRAVFETFCSQRACKKCGLEKTCYFHGQAPEDSIKNEKVWIVIQTKGTKK